MKENKSEKKTLPSVGRTLFRIILFFVYPAYVLHSLVVAPIYTVCASNVGIPEAVTVAMYYLFVLIDLLVFFVSFSVIIYGLCHLSLREMKKTLILIALSPLFKYLLKFLISPFVDGIPTIDTLIIDLYAYGISGVLEILQYLIVFALAYKPAVSYRKGVILMKKTYLSADGKSTVSFSPLVPFKKLFNFKNPLQLGAFVSAVVIIVGRVSSLAINDINNHWKIIGINQYIAFFAPYVIEIVVGFIGYFLMLYVFIQLYSKTSDK